MEVTMNYARFIPIVSSAAATTVSLFYVMQGLVASDEIIVKDIKQPVWLGTIQEIEPPVVREPDRLEPPSGPLLPPPTGDPLSVENIGGTITAIHIKPQLPTTRLPEVKLGSVDGERMPLVRVAPQYPNRCAERGLSGWVVLEFDVDAYGAVQKPSVIDNDGSGCFNRSALKTIARFKYKPTVIDGRSVGSSGVRFRMSFTLEG
jgi:protein TonB